MFPSKDVKCHHTGFTKRCHDMVVKHRCPKWVRISGNDPQTGEPAERYDCADAWLPFLLVENSKMQHETKATIQALRNDVAATNGHTAPPVDVTPALPNGHASRRIAQG